MTEADAIQFLQARGYTVFRAAVPVLNQKPELLVTRHCAFSECGKLFEITNARDLKQKKYCSRYCQRRAAQLRAKARRDAKKKKEKTP